MKRLAFIVIFLVGMTGIFHWLSEGFSATWEPKLRTYLETTVGRATQTDVQIDSIVLAFFHRVRLSNVLVTDPDDPSKPIFRAAEIELTLSFIDLPRALLHHRGYEAIGLVTVKDPWVRLSRHVLEKHSSRRKASAALPPWFTLVWQGGSFQWVDPRMPHGAWTLYQTQGVFRIRGPKTAFDMKGSAQEAKTVRVQFGSLGERWNAQTYMSEADVPAVVALAQTWSQRPLLPKGWNVRGRLNFEARASGRHRPSKMDDWIHLLDEAKLTFLPTTETPNEKNSFVSLAGALTYKGGKITGPHITIESPGFRGTGSVDFSLERLRPDTALTLNAAFPSGRLGKWPFQNAVLRTRYLHDHWEFLDNQVQLLDGNLSAKGYWSPANSNVAITAQNISLASLGETRGRQTSQGRVNASCSLRGPVDHWQVAGAWWLSGIQWGTSVIGDARGDFELAPDHFRADAKSDDSHFRFGAEGDLSEEFVTLDRFEVDLPDGASLTADGHLARATHLVRGAFEASDIAFPNDLPFLPLDHSAVKGHFDMSGRLAGTFENPTVKGDLASSDLRVNEEAIGPAKASIVWDKTHFEIPALHIEPGIDGHYTKGEGALLLNNASFGKWSFPQGRLHFSVMPGHLFVSELFLQTKESALHWDGKASWPADSRPPATIDFEGKGDAEPVSGPSPWDIRFVTTGRLARSDHGWEGQARVSAAHPVLRKISVDPFTAEVHWDHDRATWSNARWGKHWTSRGSVEWGQGPAIWTGRIEADHVLLEEWKPLLFPALKDDLHGTLNGTMNVEGTALDPKADLAFHLDNVRWRDFQFNADAAGTWSHGEIKPLTLQGHFTSGGDFLFNGLLTSDDEAQGTLKLTGFELHPLGKSLRFPKSLDGSTSATLTVNGPLESLKWSGHLEGGPIVYGTETEHPFKLQTVSMDMTLAPSDQNPSIERLALIEAQAKTSEELVRFQSGSYVEFSGDKPSNLKLGMDIRNLHLGFFTLFGGLDLDGTWQIKPQGFAIQAETHTRSLFINDYELEEGLVLADYYDGVLTFTAPRNTPALATGTVDFHHAPQLHFTNFFISGKNQEGLDLSGDIGPSLWDFQMTGHRLDVGILGELAGFPYSLSGAADVTIHGTGDRTHPHVEGKVDLDHGTALGLAYRTGSAAFIWQDTRISFTRLTLSNPGHYSLDGAGFFPLLSKDHVQGQDRSIDFSVKLQDANLSLLQSFTQEIKEAKGPVEGLIQIKGTVESPSIHGSVRVTNGDILGAHYFRHLTNANLNLNFEGDTIVVRELRGKSGQGEFRGSGTITLAGFEPSHYDLNLEIVSSKGLEVQIPELAIPESPLAKRFHFLTSASRGDLRGHVSLRGPANAPVFSGLGIISNGHFTFPPSRKNPPNPAVMEWFRRITWDVDLKFQDGASFDNELVQAYVVGNLKLKGPSDKLRVDGGLDMTDGKISYLGLQFDIQQAHYDVRSEVSGDTVVNTPYVRGIAQSQIQAVDTVSGVAGASGGSRLSVNDTITLNIDYAPVDQIKPRLTSAADPTLSQDKLLARVTQTDIQNLTPQEKTALYQTQILSLIDNSLTTPLAESVLKKTGIADRVRVQHVFDPNTAAAQDLNSAAQQQSSTVNPFANSKYTIEKDLSNRMSIGYGIRFVPNYTSDPDLLQQQSQKLDLISDVQVSYHWFKNVYLKGDFDLPSSAGPGVSLERKVTIEPRWRFGWWGNTNKDKEKPSSSQ